jgi:hypothetical protein
MINWHRLFGLALMDYFTGTGYRVEVEQDLALRRQLLDVVVIRTRERAPPLPDPCDGLEDLRAHNLLTYKSLHEPLNGWAIEELMGHYVNYRKALAPEAQAEAFGLYAVCTRRPRALAQVVALKPLKPGVYRLAVVTRPVTVIVLNEVATATRNALWGLFSGESAKVAFGARHYQWRQPDHNTVLQELYYRYHQTGVAMTYTFEDFRHDLALELVEELPPDERLKGLPPEERLKGLLPEERLKGLLPEERLKGLPPEERLRDLPVKERLKGLSLDELLKSLSTDELEQLRRLLEKKSVS